MKFLITLLLLLLITNSFAQEVHPIFKISTKNLLKNGNNLLDDYKFESGSFDEIKGDTKMSRTVGELFEEDINDSCIRMPIEDGISCIHITEKHSGKMMKIYFRFCQEIIYGKLIEIKGLSFKSGMYLYDMCKSESRFKTMCLETNGHFESSNRKSRDGEFERPPRIIFLTEFAKHKILPSYLKITFELFKCY